MFLADQSVLEMNNVRDLKLKPKLELKPELPSDLLVVEVEVRRKL